MTQFQRWFLVVVALLGTLEAGADTPDLVAQGQRAFQKGSFNQAAEDWQKALVSFRKKGNAKAEILTALSLASAYQNIGEQQRAVQLLQTALDRAQKSGDRSMIILVKSKLGAALLMTLDLGRAAALLNESLESARTNGDSKLAGGILNDLGNLLNAQQKYSEALNAFEDSISLARQTSNSWLTAQALCNAAATAALARQFPRAEDLNTQAIRQTERLDASHTKTFLLLTTGQTDRQIKPDDAAAANRLRQRAQHSFQQALELAQNIQDRPIETYALGYLGQLYQEDGQTDTALALTRSAAFAAQQAQMPEALYRWEWQSGRLLKARGEIIPAISAYRQAVQTLQPIRNDVSFGYGNATVHPPFREAEGPLFFELADLLLGRANSVSDPNQARELILEARDTVEQLKAVELEDYFRDDCVNVQKAKTRSIEAVDAETAVVYLISLPERTEVLVGLTSSLKRFTLPVGAEALTAEVRQFRRNLETRTTYGYLEQAQQLYNWLIRPLRAVLDENHIKTLVFVPDGPLRTIPLSSLSDGERYLIQDFAVAVAPGLSLVEPHAIERGKVRLLLSGLSEAVQGFPPLTFVTGELQSIEPLYPNEVLENEEFTSKELREKLTDEQFSIVHIASHGKFDRDVRKTFVLTYDSKLTLNDLESLIRPSQYRGRPVELLVLSACQTAAGDDRAALGLAGVAVKAGARSALATLWFVNDQSTSQLISEFYSQLRQSPMVSKARCLQLAQMKLLTDRRYRHPCYWSPYLIIGNWL
jgi:CHAT domain-containing protein/Tfp pilus assembly protein PilF